MDIRDERNGAEGTFYMEEGGQRIAEMNYTLTGEKTMCILHTGVDEAYEGKGLGKALVERAIAQAEEEGLTIDPRCPFARKVIERLSH